MFCIKVLMLGNSVFRCLGFGQSINIQASDSKKIAWPTNPG